MSAPMTSERCARLLADTKRILDLVEGPWTVPDRRDMEALSRIVQDVPALLAEVERLRAELAQIQTAVTYLQGPEECLERECEEYFDDHGNERPGVEYCSHLKAKRLTVDEHLAALSERDDVVAELEEERLTGDALRKNRDQIHDELAAARAALAEERARHGEQAKPKGDEVLDWVAECDQPGHPDWYLHSENWPYEKRDCPTCAVEQAEAERDRHAEQVKRTETAVHAFFADADQRGVHLDGMTVTELCGAVMAEIRALGGTEDGQ